MSGDTTVKITFDCGGAGEVTWKAPRTFFGDRVSDDTIQRLGNIAWGDTVGSLFKLMAVLTKIRGPIAEFAIKEIDTNLRATAARVRRLIVEG